MSDFDDDIREGKLDERAGGARPPRRASESPSANPDDPTVQRPPRGPHGPLPGPHSAGVPGRIAIVQTQVFLVAVLLIAQLWIITTALFELLSGRPRDIWGLALASGVGFLLALFIALWPLRRVRGL